jgi:tetratricopeptide repeat protein 21B
MHDAREALKELNLARKDVTWGAQALGHMIEIYINPGNEALFAQEVADEDSSSSGGGSGASSAAALGAVAENLAAAERLLKELSLVLGPEGGARITVLESYIQVRARWGSGCAGK